jgi:son of sevenless-like protein
MELSRSHRDLAAIQESDRAELREMLQNIAMSVDELKAIQRMHSPAAAEMVQSIEEVCHPRSLSDLFFLVTTYAQELDDPDLETAEKRDLQQGLKQIRQHAASLPPMTDCKPCSRQVNKIPQLVTVTGQIERVSEYPVALGTFNDIYIGEPAAI